MERDYMCVVEACGFKREVHKYTHPRSEMTARPCCACTAASRKLKLSGWGSRRDQWVEGLFAGIDTTERGEMVKEHEQG